MSFEEVLGSLEIGPNKNEGSEEEDQIAGFPPQDTAEKMIGRFLDAVVSGNDESIKASFGERAKSLLKEFPNLEAGYHVLALFEPLNSIDDGDLDSIFSSLRRSNPDKKKNVCLILLSRGGSIEPAYQISKLCKQWSASKFVVSIPRYAKSAATLIALGADEIHIGPLGQLGPIDPQLSGLPALSVSQALQTIAQLAEKHPGSSIMFAEYLRQVLTVEQIGYCDRIAQSASQYAHRLLSNKPSISDRVEHIANRLVQEYKDHSFVIDIEESRKLLGDDLVKSDTDELELAERLYQLFDEFNYWLKYRDKKLLLTGDLEKNIIILDRKSR
jgi:hypothetical protein